HLPHRPKLFPYTTLFRSNILLLLDMQKFNDILPVLPSVDHLQAMELRNTDGSIAALIENKPGSSGSLKVYHHLWKKWGCIDADADRKSTRLNSSHVKTSY